MSIEAMKRALDAIDSAHADMRDEIAALRQAIEQAEKQAQVCECHRCIKENDLRDGAFPLSSTKMILCPDCGNKRCPKASDHRLQCTNSNETGQAGSIYTAPPQAEKQEPVAWMEDSIEFYAKDHPTNSCTIPLYTAPPRKQWIGLTNQEVNEIRKDIFEKYKKALLVTRDVTSENDYSAFNFYRAIEDKLRSKNDI